MSRQDSSALESNDHIRESNGNFIQDVAIDKEQE